MDRNLKRDIVNVRKHKPSKINNNCGVLGWYKHLDRLERGLKYEILRTQKAKRRQQQQSKQQQEHLRVGGGKDPWGGWCNTIPTHVG